MHVQAQHAEDASGALIAVVYVDEVALSAAEARALVAGDPDVLARVQLQTDIHKLDRAPPGGRAPSDAAV